MSEAISIAPDVALGGLGQFLAAQAERIDKLEGELIRLNARLADTEDGAAWCSVAEIAEHSRLSADGVYRLISAHRSELADEGIAAKVNGKSWRIDRRRWDKWARQR